jgi:hypothetical protein
VPERVAMLVYLDAFCPGARPVHVRPDACVHAGRPGSSCPVQRSRVADAADSVGAARPTRRGRCWSGSVPRTRAPGSARPASDRNLPRAGRAPEPARDMRCRRSRSRVGCMATTTRWPPVDTAVRAAGIPIHVLPTGHFPMMTMPVELADLLESLLPV